MRAFFLLFLFALEPLEADEHIDVDRLAYGNAALRAWVEQMDGDVPYILIDRSRAHIRLMHGRAILRDCIVLRDEMGQQPAVRDSVAEHLRRYRSIDPWVQLDPGPYDWEYNLVEAAPDNGALYLSSSILIYADPVWNVDLLGSQESLLRFFCLTFYISLLIVQTAAAGPNADVEIGFTALSKPCGLKAGDRIEFVIAARNMEAVRQIKLDFSWNRPGAIAAAVGSTADATEAEFFIAPGPPQIEGDTATYGMAVFGGEGLGGEGNIALLGFELSSEITADTPLALYIDAVSLGPSFTERDTIFPVEAALLVNYCDDEGQALTKGLFTSAPDQPHFYSMVESAQQFDGSAGEMVFVASTMRGRVFRADEILTWNIDNSGPGTIYALGGDKNIRIDPGAKEEILTLSNRRGNAILLLDTHGTTGDPTNALLTVCSAEPDSDCWETPLTWNEPITAIIENNTATPQVTRLDNNYPNPFNASTVIPFSIAHSGTHVRLDIFNMQGQQLNTLTLGPKTAGHYQIQWDGRDALGNEVASGVYLYRLRANSNEHVRRMLLLR